MASVLIWFFICFLPNTNPSLSDGTSPAKGLGTGPKLTISISSASFSVGERIPVNLQLLNSDDNDLMVGRYLSPTFTSPSYVMIKVQDRAERLSPSELWTEFLEPKVTQNWWLPIAPGHTYGTILVIDRNSHPFLSQPGEYRLTAEYVSRGTSDKTLDEQGSEVVPKRVWEGTVVSNTIWIRVLP